MNAAPWLLALTLLNAPAAVEAPLDLMASQALRGPGGAVLPGTSPHAGLAGQTPEPGARVQILEAGADGVAGLPDALGLPTGDDRLLGEFFLGEGMPPQAGRTGRLSATLARPPAAGTVLFVRVLHAATGGQATHWGQSNRMPHQPLQVLDLSALGLRGALIPLSANPAAVDSDGDGMTDLDEWTANTDATRADDVLRLLPGADPGHWTNPGRVGRRYHLERAQLTPGVQAVWVGIGSTGVLTRDEPLVWDDPTAPALAFPQFIRVRAEAP